ncbi:MAG: 16S rRNA (guanine(527)-N(7))-methyltransferase RsmG [Candidatus Cryptobacteroides sp.]
MNFNEFRETVRLAFPEVSERQLEQFAMMDEAYRDWNAKINVISRKDVDGLYSHHVLHSLAIARYLRTQKLAEYSEMTLPDNGLKVLDLGTGGGFPGIPLAVMFPEVSFTLCDSIRKKTVVAAAVAGILGLDNVEVVNARAESLGTKFDYVVSRAVASLTDFYPWVRGCFGRSVLCLKGGDVAEEIAAMSAREKLPAGTVATWKISAWLPDEYFDGKFVVDIASRK